MVVLVNIAIIAIVAVVAVVVVGVCVQLSAWQSVKNR